MYATLDVHIVYLKVIKKIQEIWEVLCLLKKYQD